MIGDVYDILTPGITVTIKPKLNWWENPRLCYFCGHQGDDVHQYGTHHLGGHGEVPEYHCDCQIECFYRRHENVRAGREEWQNIVC